MMETKTNPDICENCGESRNPKTARFEHRRIGLNEPPEPVLCRCRDPTELFESMKRKIALTTEHIKTLDNTTMLLLPSPNPNMVMVDSIAKIPVREVEIRLDAHLAKVLFERMESGLFTNATVKEVREIGCIWWTGRDANTNAKIRKRSNGESVVKISRSRYVIVPGYTLAMSDEYGFEGRIKDPIYDVRMTEISTRLEVMNSTEDGYINVTITARRYRSGDTPSYACEFEVEDEPSNIIVRRIVALSVGMVGCVESMAKIIDIDFLSDIRSKDHVVVDVPTMDGYKGVRMAKADGVKVYVLCYDFGYVVTTTDPVLTVQSCMVTISDDFMPQLTKRPDVVVAEMLIDGSLVYIGTLAVDGRTLSSDELYLGRCPITRANPGFIYRRCWDTTPTPAQLRFEPTPNDGVVLVNKLRTMRLKMPTVDLMCLDGKMCAIDGGTMIPIADADSNMEENAVYEMDVVKNRTSGSIQIVMPRMRVAKKVPNSMDVVKRAVASATKDPNVSATLLDITSMSFSMRERLYTMAQTRPTRPRG
ncbi:uncharacterized protein PG986_014681 [Apiospora aurea]|uniref:Uncharacterized protein n=1 Tax=Apiospora aurea TaxID=335848 RepID=A0ABR1PTR8_9PEZI